MVPQSNLHFRIFLSKFLKRENAAGAFSCTDILCRENLSDVSNSCWKLAS